MPIPAYPLQWPQGWPRTENRHQARFGKTETTRNTTFAATTWKRLRPITIAEATNRVRIELQRMAVRSDDFVISTNLLLRLDGFPRSDQRQVKDPGVAVYWTATNGARPLVMAIDLYDQVTDNLAAIAATLEAMRQIKRHGGAMILERAFTGFAALPAPPDCWAVLGLDVTRKPDRLSIDSAFRRIAKTVHPDNGGSEDMFQRLTLARNEALRIAEASWLSA